MRKTIKMNAAEAYQYGRQLLASKNYISAKTIFSKLLENDPYVSNIYGRWDIYNALGHIYYGLKEYKLSVEMFEKSLSEHPTDSHYYTDYAKTLQTFGMHDKAIAILKKSLEYNPGNVQVFRSLATQYTYKKEYETSISFTKKCVEINPISNDFANLCLCYFLLGKEKQAKKSGYKALVMKDKEVVTNFNTLQPKILSHLKNKTYNQLEPIEIIKPKDSENVITFSLWGDNPTYVKGALENIDLASKFYPDWVCRFYCDPHVSKVIISSLVNKQAQVFIMPESINPFDKYSWRVFVTDDPTVKRFISRDCDCRINIKEQAAVEEWCKSDKSFHVMRDDIVHCELILAGLWGGLTAKLPNLYALYKDTLAPYSKWADQQFLGQYVWPYIKSDVLVHDTFYQFGGATFPKRDYSGMVGNVGAGFVVKNEA